MKLHEYQAKELLGRFGVPVPRNAGACSAPDEVRHAVEELGGRAVLKAQVHTGGRGKAGGIRIVNSPDEGEVVAREMLGMLLKTYQAPQGIRVEKLLVEEPITVTQEFYVGFVPDRAAARNAFIFSPMGGMDIEAVAEEHPEAIAREHLDPVLGLQPYQVRRACHRTGVPKDLVPRFVPVLLKLAEAFLHLDASLLEINPLAVTSQGAIVAADAKFSIDDNALFRHPELATLREEAAEDPIEAEAQRRGIQYVRLDGSVGVMGNGAGLVMATLDEVARAGGKAANFLDVGGGARAEVVRSSLELILMNPAVRSILINIYGGITRCDEVAKGILEALKDMEVRVPLVVRLTGTRAAEGAAILQNTELITADTMQEAARKAVEAATTTG